LLHHAIQSPGHETASADRQILAMTDTELEQFVRDWVELKKNDYVEIERFTVPATRRDVVGYITKKRHDGRVAQLSVQAIRQARSAGLGLGELGKVLYYASRGEFTPRRDSTCCTP